jgi:hypothetical protein
MEGLPPLRDIPEALSDSDLLQLMKETFKALRESPPPHPVDFTPCVQWILQLVIVRGEDKANLLFHAGIILLNPIVAINAAVLGAILSMTPESVTRKLKVWPAVPWDNDEKLALLNVYDRESDPRGWSIRQPPPDSVFFRFALSGSMAPVFRPMEQIMQRIPEVNKIPPPPYMQPSILNLSGIRSRRFETKVIRSEAPVVWTFDEQPVVTLDLS